MPVSVLDPATALVVIDLQVGITQIPTVPLTPAQVIANAALLAAAFRRRQLPVMLVNVTGTAPGRTEMPRPSLTLTPEWSAIVPELDRQPGDVLVTKQSWGAFYGTALEMSLRRRGVTQLVMCGISTSAGVESTARAAFDHGYHLAFATDAMADRSIENHTHSIERIFPRLGEIGSTADIVARLS